MFYAIFINSRFSLHSTSMAITLLLKHIPQYSLGYKQTSVIDSRTGDFKWVTVMLIYSWVRTVIRDDLSIQIQHSKKLLKAISFQRSAEEAFIMN